MLLQRARELCEIALAAVEDRKSGKKPSLTARNRFLANAPSHAAVTTDDAKNIRVTRVYGKETVEATTSLAPHQPTGDLGTGPKVSFTRSGLTVPWNSR